MFCKLIQRYCAGGIDIKLTFSTFKVGSMFSVKDPVPFDLRSLLMYKSVFCCIGETSPHLIAHVREHLSRDRNSHISQHLQQSQISRRLCCKKCFTILVSAPNRVQFSLKKAAHIRWDKTVINKQLKHAELHLVF